MYPKAFVLLLLLLCIPSEILAQTHFSDCARYTGNNATILIPSGATLSVNGAPLAKYSEIGVFTDDGRCAGVVVWKGEATGLTIWGDDSQSDPKDGFASGETLSYKVWDASAELEYDGAAVNTSVQFSDAQPFYSTQNAYDEDAIYELVEFSIWTEGAPDGATGQPEEITLYQNFPNPFNPSTTIQYRISETAPVEITVYNAAGAQVAELLDEEMPAGLHTLQWSADRLPSGAYFGRVRVGDETRVITMMLLK